MSAFSLRDYQLTAANAIEEAWKTHQSTLCVKPTGTGKTVLFAEIIRRRQPGRSMVIAHREELIFQAREKIERFAGLECEIEMGELVASTSLYHAMPVVVATVQTLVSGRKKKRMDRFNPMDFSTLVIDEFHHATAASYRKCLDYFIAGNPDIKILGVTATPDRTDEEALGQVCESVAFNYQIIDAIHDGWLVPVEQKFVSIDGLDFSTVRTTAGDLNGADLAAIMEAEKNLQGLCAATLDIIGARQTIVFTASVKQAEMACAIFNRHRSGIAEWVCGATDKEARRKTMKAVISSKTQILCNVGVATEGFDAPGVEVIVMGRPTKSRSLYAQMAGRATRPLPGVVDGPTTADDRKQAIADSGKANCLLVDFVGNSGRHKLMSGLDILGGKYSDEVKELAHEIMERDGSAWRISQALDEAEEQLRAKQQKEAEARRKSEEARKARLVAKASFTSCPVDPFDAYGIKPSKSEWNPDGKTLTEKQRAMLTRQGIDPDQMSYRNAKNLLNEMFRRINEDIPSPKMQALLNKHGYDGATIKRSEAGKIIEALKANGWRLPADMVPVPAQVIKEKFAAINAALQAAQVTPEPEGWF